MEERVSRLEGIAEQMSERLAENHAEHTNLRADLGRLETKVDSLDRDLNAKIDTLGRDLNAKIDGLHQMIHALHQMIVRALLIGLVLAAGVIVATLIRPLF